MAQRVRAREQRRFYPEVQALRAVAIGMVLLFHFGSGIPFVGGGLVGVDVFFVISGFLISGHLLAELDRTGRVRLADFYARRARRLLPASLSVLLAVAVATALILPREAWGDAGRSVLASAFYAMNLYAAHLTALGGQEAFAALPTVHYWSLSAEEQFYLLWPPLILLAAAVASWLGRRGRAVGRVTAVGIALTVVAVVSFVVALVWTWIDYPVAYFVTVTRVWEFAAGGLVALLLRRWAPTQRTATVLRWLGLILILPGSLLLVLPDVMPGPGVLPAVAAFPAPLAVPAVLGTALVIIAGGTRPGSFLDRVVKWRPTQWLGLISYSVYLWHWPLVPLTEALLGQMGAPVRIALLALSLLLGHVWQRWVEDASRYVPGMKQSTRMSLWAALAGMLVVGGVGLLLAVAGGS
ncbi:putative acyltransferase [Kineosphaera limosa NBRC 100340]|uniref:Putative acyltransferase n=1 Tax=Kineosphaera limosa NBRC 100340 TaxID=1184609 RepID=K6XHN3_9MICO|nr:putative acyltransferase [Kineosphaera limosa NBRC 100340]